MCVAVKGMLPFKIELNSLQSLNVCHRAALIHKKGRQGHIIPACLLKTTKYLTIGVKNLEFA